MRCSDPLLEISALHTRQKRYKTHAFQGFTAEVVALAGNEDLLALHYFISILMD